MERNALITVLVAAVGVILATVFVVAGLRPRNSEGALHFLIGVMIGATVVGLAAVAAFFIFD